MEKLIILGSEFSDTLDPELPLDLSICGKLPNDIRGSVIHELGSHRRSWRGRGSDRRGCDLSLLGNPNTIELCGDPSPDKSANFTLR